MAGRRGDRGCWMSCSARKQGCAPKARQAPGHRERLGASGGDRRHAQSPSAPPVARLLCGTRPVSRRRGSGSLRAASEQPPQPAAHSQCPARLGDTQMSTLCWRWADAHRPRRQNVVHPPDTYTTHSLSSVLPWRSACPAHSCLLPWPARPSAQAVRVTRHRSSRQMSFLLCSPHRERTCCAAPPTASR